MVMGSFVMSMFSSLACAFVVTVSISGTSGSHKIAVVHQVSHASSFRVSAQSVADCDQSSNSTASSFSIPRLEFHIKPQKKQLDSRDEEPTGFCAAFSGPMDGGPRCDFQLLA